MRSEAKRGKIIMQFMSTWPHKENTEKYLGTTREIRDDINFTFNIEI